MKSISFDGLKEKYKSFRSDKKAVFGLLSIQQFFTIILGLAILAYVIVVIMGVLNGSSVLPSSTLSATVSNETGAWINSSGYTVSKASTLGFSSFAVSQARGKTNSSNPLVTINVANYTVNSNTGVVTNNSAQAWVSVQLDYSYNYNSGTVNNANDILSNTSLGVSGFFSSINPVYAILAILVIILVLVVLVRVVNGSTEGGGSGRAPQL